MKKYSGFILGVLLFAGGFFLWQGSAFSATAKLKESKVFNGKGGQNITARSGNASPSEVAKFCEQFPNEASCTCSSGTKINYQGKYQCVASTACTALPGYSACTCPSGTKISYEGQYICASSLTCASLPQYASCTCPSGTRIYNDGKYQCATSLSCNDVPTYASCTCSTGTKILDGGQYKCATSLACANVPNYASCTCATGETRSASAPYTCTAPSGNYCTNGNSKMSTDPSCTCPSGEVKGTWTGGYYPNGTTSYSCYKAGECDLRDGSVEPNLFVVKDGHKTDCTCPAGMSKNFARGGWANDNRFMCLYTTPWNGNCKDIVVNGSVRAPEWRSDLIVGMGNPVVRGIIDKCGVPLCKNLCGQTKYSADFRDTTAHRFSCLEGTNGDNIIWPFQDARYKAKALQVSGGIDYGNSFFCHGTSNITP